MRVRLKHEQLGKELAKRAISTNRWAQQLGVSSGHLSDLVNGRRPYPAPATRHKLMQGLDLPFEALFEIRQPTPRQPAPKSVPAVTRFIDASRDRPTENPARRGGDPTMNTLLRDFRYAARGLLRSPTFSAAAILTLAIGIASNTALVSIVDSVLWKPFPYHDSDRLVVLQSASSSRGLRWSNLSFPNARDLRGTIAAPRELRGLGLGALWAQRRSGAGPHRWDEGLSPILRGARDRAHLWPNVSPRRGSAGSGARHGDQRGSVANLLWRQRCCGRLRSGQTLSPTTIVGIMPAGTEYPDQTRLWVPMRFDDVAAPRGANFLGSIARLRDGADMTALEAEIRTIGQRLVDDYPEVNHDRVFRATPLRQVLIGDIEPITLTLLGVVTFVLLIVCANVANLLLARGATREREVAIRRALGASGRRLAQLLLSEALLLAVAGGLLGFGLGWLGIQWIVATIADEIPPWVQTGLDGRIVVYTLGVTLFAGLLFSLFPLLQNLRFGFLGALREGDNRQGISVRSGRLRSSLVVSEVALSLVLLAGAGLMVKSLLDLSSVDPGFETRGSLTVGLDLLSQVQAEPTERHRPLPSLPRTLREPTRSRVGRCDRLLSPQRALELGADCHRGPGRRGGASEPDATVRPGDAELPSGHGDPPLERRRLRLDPALRRSG